MIVRRNTKGECDNKIVFRGIYVRHKAMKPIGIGRYSRGEKRCHCPVKNS